MAPGLGPFDSVEDFYAEQASRAESQRARDEADAKRRGVISQKPKHYSRARIDEFKRQIIIEKQQEIRNGS